MSVCGATLPTVSGAEVHVAQALRDVVDERTFRRRIVPRKGAAGGDLSPVVVMSYRVSLITVECYPGNR